mmetsp:Transcript_107686/g.335808  ORF Transcript_107686/g.335808 Transcript_107686/m.335808 type:complete len:319 (+) Transcript_107686:149-1105(+)
MAPSAACPMMLHRSSPTSALKNCEDNCAAQSVKLHVAQPLQPPSTPSGPRVSIAPAPADLRLAGAVGRTAAARASHGAAWRRAAAGRGLRRRWLWRSTRLRSWRASSWCGLCRPRRHPARYWRSSSLRLGRSGCRCASRRRSSGVGARRSSLPTWTSGCRWLGCICSAMYTSAWSTDWRRRAAWRCCFAPPAAPSRAPCVAAGARRRAARVPPPPPPCGRRGPGRGPGRRHGASWGRSCPAPRGAGGLSRQKWTLGASGFGPPTPEACSTTRVSSCPGRRGARSTVWSARSGGCFPATWYRCWRTAVERRPCPSEARD